MLKISQKGWWTLWLAYALFLLAATQYPFRYHFNADYFRLRTEHIQSFPKIIIGNHTVSRRNLADYPVNLALFFPFGFFGYRAISDRFSNSGRGRPSTGSGTVRLFLLLVLVAFIFSTGIEFLQLFTETRFATVSDVIDNTTGAFVGVLFAAFI